MPLTFQVDGRAVEVADDGASLLEVLRDRLGLRSPKDGCSPQGQCGCCTVLVDGQPRVACVTPARRIAGRTVTTLDGLPEAVRTRWAEAFLACGASQCGFCTPGIIVRLAALHAAGRGSEKEVDNALLAHLCRCTGWNTIKEAFVRAATAGPLPAPLGTGQPPAMPAAATPATASPPPSAMRDLGAAARRATIEGGVPQQVGTHVALGAAGFADDTAPPDALVAVPDGAGGWAVGETLTEARALAGKVQGRRSTIALVHPLEIPPGPWDVTLRTTWTEPAYLEPDASWCQPGGEPASPVANGGAFGGKTSSVAPAAARRLADEHGRAVRVLLSREDVVRLGPKRPPVAGGARRDGTGVLRVVRTPGVAEAVRAVAPGLVVEEVDFAGLSTSIALRAAGWAEAAVLLAAARNEANSTVTAPSGARAEAGLADDGSVQVRVACGDPLDDVVLRSFCVGAAHMALGWARTEGIAVDGEGVPHDLTIRSFGVLRAQDMPAVTVEIDDAAGPPVNGSDAVFAAVAAAAWRADGYPTDWPTHRGAR
ncbi:MAG TPA: 2Fe-2S iron-sulfur cluster-binding protein [Acidimicrobiales bacterium]|nr:2Fe-2S iron-sulfur cluster-binding protein [Acidimicrobiales bacterium]